MKKFIVLYLLVSFCAVNAQTASAADSGSPRESLKDTILVTAVDRSFFDSSYDSFNNGTDDAEHSKYLWEYAIYRIMEYNFRKELDRFSDDELKLILEYQRSLPYRYLNSSIFLENLFSNLVKAIEMEGGQMNGFSYKLNDKAYSALWKEYADEVRAFTDIDAFLNEDNLVAQAKQNGLPADQVSLYVAVLRRVFDNIGDIYALSCVDYLSMENIEEMASFTQSPVIQKYLSVFHVAGQLIETMTEKELERIMQEATPDAVIDYFCLSRSIPRLVPELYRPVKEISSGKGVYSGETRDGLPHGRGVLTDKKGRTYSGDFKNGKRHGLISFTDSDGNTEFQTWVDDRHIKNVPASPSPDGQVPDVQEHNGKLCGYGKHYDHMSMTHYEGFFIDGEFLGRGTKRTAQYEMTGEFRPSGHFIGTVSWKEPEWSVSRFQGKVYDNIREGFYRGVKADGSIMVTRNGVFVDSMLDGQGSVTYSMADKNIREDGIYAFGNLCGKGARKIVMKPDSNGISESSVYEGDFLTGNFNGHGHYVTDLSGISPHNWTFTRCGVKVKNINDPSITIEMDGSFEEGKLIEGNVTVSTGHRMEGKFVSGELHEGKETVVYHDGTRAEYTVSGGVRSGDCRIEYADGSVYEGPYKNMK